MVNKETISQVNPGVNNHINGERDAYTRRTEVLSLVNKETISQVKPGVNNHINGERDAYTRKTKVL